MVWDLKESIMACWTRRTSRVDVVGAGAVGDLGDEGGESVAEGVGEVAVSAEDGVDVGLADGVSGGVLAMSPMVWMP